MLAPPWVWVGTSIAIAAALLANAVYTASMSDEMPWFWWMNLWGVFKDPGFYTLLGLGMFGVAAVPLAHGVARRTHPSLTVAVLLSSTLVYLFDFRIWLGRPGQIVDGRPFFTIGFSLVPLYIALFALAGHALIWWRSRG